MARVASRRVRARVALRGLEVWVRIPRPYELSEPFREAGGVWDREVWAWRFPLSRFAGVVRHLEGDEGELVKVLQGNAFFAYALAQEAERESPLLHPEQQEEAWQVLGSLSGAFLPGGRWGFVLASGTGTGKTYVYARVLQAVLGVGLPALLVVPNEDLIRQTREVLSRFGVAEGEAFRITTYARLRPEEAWCRVLVLDEAHLAKRAYGSEGSARGMRALEAAWRALFTLYATATPFDRPWEARYLLEPTGFVPYRLFTCFMRQFAVYTRERYRGGREFYFAGGIEDLARFHGYLRDRNLLTKRLFRPPEGLVAYEVPLLEVPEEAKALLAEVRRRLKAAAYRAPQEERGIVMAQRTLLSRAILERIKLRAALPLVAGLLEEGWHVLLFVQYRSDKTLDLTSPEAVEAFLQDAEERGLKGALHRHLAPALKGLGLTLPSPVAMVREAFGGLGEDLAFYTGAETGSALRRTKAAWDEGRVRLLLATAGKGGVGLSFHDTTGKRPTAQIVLTLPWTATGLDQVLGRVVRLGMKSPVRILFPAAPVPFEQQLAATVAQSLRTLGYAVRGGEGVVPERVVEAFLYDLAAVDLMGFLRLLEAEESLSKAPREEEEASSLEVPLPPSG